VLVIDRKALSQVQASLEPYRVIASDTKKLALEKVATAGAIRGRGHDRHCCFERLLARDDTREMLDSLLLHIGTAYETEIWGHVRKFIVLDIINDLLAITIRSSTSVNAFFFTSDGLASDFQFIFDGACDMRRTL